MRERFDRDVKELYMVSDVVTMCMHVVTCTWMLQDVQEKEKERVNVIKKALQEFAKYVMVTILVVWQT